MRRSPVPMRFAVTPATIVAIPPPNHRVKPSTCTSSQNPLIPRLRPFWYGPPSVVSPVELMPVLDLFFSLLPAPEYFFAVELAVEVHQSLLESFEHAADLLELAEVVVDPARHLVDAAAQPHLLGRLAPFRPRLLRHQFVLAHQVAPFGMQRHQIGDDALHERKRAIGVG